jgi:protein TonB
MVPAFVQAQEGEPSTAPVEQPPAIAADQQPEFIGGEPAMIAFFGANIRYPEKERVDGVQGKAWVRFTVEADGAISHVLAVRGPSPALNREAERVVQAMPKWVPGRVNGQPAPIGITLPVEFSLREQPEKP